MAQPVGAVPEPSSSDPQPQARSPPPSQPAFNAINPAFPANSAVDSGLSKRPRDARLIHMILANLGVTAYQERVPLQLMDFAYRYTSSTLQDALHLTSEGYGTTTTTGTGKSGGAHNDVSSINLQSLRLSIASRTHYQFNPSLPKDFYQEIAQERNRVALPLAGKEGGIKLPPERYCLAGIGWGLRDEWDSEGDEEAEKGSGTGEVDDNMEEEAEGDRMEETEDNMEDVFGDGIDEADDDKDMEEG
ncbi:Transcription initiation factor TFIID subunit 9 [Bachmanniomyces sp. S44760]|nr:Transcription initiation factor TFIID subunit 9 [Bachmanniomyces sp. S44760]